MAQNLWLLSGVQLWEGIQSYTSIFWILDNERVISNNNYITSIFWKVE